MAFKSLRDSCLSKIVDNFEHYMTVFNSGNASFRIQFEYIQRAFSERLYTDLRLKLKPEYVPFLLNPHLKKLHITSSVFDDANILIDRLKVIGDTITHFSSIHIFWREYEIIKIFSLMPNVESVNLSQLYCSDNILKQIRESCKHLHTLDISCCDEVSDKGLMWFCVGKTSPPCHPSNLNSTLKSLDISGCHNVTDNGVSSVLNYLPGLESLKYANLAHVLYAIKKRMKKKLKRNSKKKNPAAMSMPKYNLRSLDINLYESHLISNPHMLGVIIKACASMCPKVTKILVDGVARSNAIDSCIDFQELESVSFNCDYFLNYSLRLFLQKRGNSLTELKVSCAVISTSEVIQSCSKMQKLYLHACRFTDSNESDAKALPVLSQLKELEFGQMDLKDPKSYAHCCSLITSSPNLQRLSLRSCNPVPNQILDCISQSRCRATLRELDFSSTYLTMDSVKKVALACSKLKSVDLTHCELSETECIDLVHILKEANSNVSLVFQHDYSLEEISSDDDDYEIFDSYGYDLDSYSDDDDDDDYVFDLHSHLFFDDGEEYPYFFN